MFVVRATNVNDAYTRGMKMLHHHGYWEDSRGGRVLTLPAPVTTVYQNPHQRVLFHEKRDANPFFHLFESLWMLDGWRQAQWLDQFVSDFSKRYAQKDGMLHGAYGYRWRQHFQVKGEEKPITMERTSPEEVTINVKSAYSDLDQLDVAIRKLKDNHRDRQVVIQMWDPSSDFLIGHDLKDIPCNLCVLPRIVTHDNQDFGRPKLDITVVCRSNDAIWGAYGANAVHFSILQEYLAAMIDVDIGTYYQLSNNFHAYADVIDRFWKGDAQENFSYPYSRGEEYGHKLTVKRLVDDPEKFMPECTDFLRWARAENANHVRTRIARFSNSFFSEVAVPMYEAHRHAKMHDYSSAYIALMEMPVENDWRHAAHQWIARRQAKFNAKQGEANATSLVFSDPPEPERSSTDGE